MKAVVDPKIARLKRKDPQAFNIPAVAGPNNIQIHPKTRNKDRFPGFAFLGRAKAIDGEVEALSRSLFERAQPIDDRSDDRICFVPLAPPTGDVNRDVISNLI